MEFCGAGVGDCRRGVDVVGKAALLLDAIICSYIVEFCGVLRWNAGDDTVTALLVGIVCGDGGWRFAVVIFGPVPTIVEAVDGVSVVLLVLIANIFSMIEYLLSICKSKNKKCFIKDKG